MTRNKQAFFSSLRSRLASLPPEDLEERLDFYNEMIDDRMEEGLSEEEAVAQVGDVDEIVTQILADTPLSTLVKERIKPKKRLRPWEIVLLAVGSPLWLSLLIAAFGVVFALYAVLWSLIVSLWAVFASFVGCALGCVTGGAVITLRNPLPGIALIGAGILCAGLSVFLFLGCKAATKGMAKLTKKIALGIKYCFVKKEAAS